MNVKNRIAAKLMIATACCAASVAVAQAAEPTQVHVNYADLNPGEAAGAKVLYRRIRAAADKACVVPETNQMVFLALKKSCMDKAIAEAVARVNEPALTAIHAGTPAVTPAKIVLNR